MTDIAGMERSSVIMMTIRLTLLFLAVAVQGLAAMGLEWEKTYPETEAPYFVRLDQNGNVYVIGRYYVESPENAEIFVKKYLPNGTLAWSDTTSGSDLKLPIAAQADEQGNVYVLAQFSSQNVSPAIVYRFNSSDGSIAWGVPYLPTGNFKQSAGRDLILDAAGNVLVIANFIIDDPAHPLRSDVKSYLLRFSAGGSLLWSKEDALSEASVAFERLGTSGNTIFIMGSALDLDNSFDGFVAAYNLAGDSLWTNYSGLDAQSGVFVQANVVDSSGDFLAVFSDLNSTTYKKFSPAGSLIFDKTGPRLGFNFVNAACPDRRGYFYWVVSNSGGQQLLQGRNSFGDLVVDKTLGALPGPFPIKLGGNNTLLTWSAGNRAAQYSLSGNSVWLSDEIYSSVGDFVSTTTGESYWILYVYDDVIPDLLYRKLVKYDLVRDCGDADASGRLDIADAVFFINYIFAGGPPPMDKSAGDFDCSGGAYITDIVHLISYLFVSGAAPCANCP